MKAFNINPVGKKGAKPEPEKNKKDPKLKCSVRIYYLKLLCTV